MPTTMATGTDDTGAPEAFDDTAAMHLNLATSSGGSSSSSSSLAPFLCNISMDTIADAPASAADATTSEHLLQGSRKRRAAGAAAPRGASSKLRTTRGIRVGGAAAGDIPDDDAPVIGADDLQPNTAPKPAATRRRAGATATQPASAEFDPSAVDVTTLTEIESAASVDFMNKKPAALKVYTNQLTTQVKALESHVLDQGARELMDRINAALTVVGAWTAFAASLTVTRTHPALEPGACIQAWLAVKSSDDSGKFDTFELAARVFNIYIDNVIGLLVEHLPQFAVATGSTAGVDNNTAVNQFNCLTAEVINMLDLDDSSIRVDAMSRIADLHELRLNAIIRLSCDVPRQSDVSMQDFVRNMQTKVIEKLVMHMLTARKKYQNGTPEASSCLTALTAMTRSLLELQSISSGAKEQLQTLQCCLLDYQSQSVQHVRVALATVRAGTSPIVAATRLVGTSILANATPVLASLDCVSLHVGRLDAIKPQVQRFTFATSVLLPELNQALDLTREVFQVASLPTESVANEATALLSDMAGVLYMFRQPMINAMLDVLRQHFSADDDESRRCSSSAKTMLAHTVKQVADLLLLPGLINMCSGFTLLQAAVNYMLELAGLTELDKCATSLVSAVPATVDCELVKLGNLLLSFKTLLATHPCVNLQVVLDRYTATVVAHPVGRIVASHQHRAQLMSTFNMDQFADATGSVILQSITSIGNQFKVNDFRAVRHAFMAMWSGLAHIKDLSDEWADAVGQSMWYRAIELLPVVVQLCHVIVPTMKTLTQPGQEPSQALAEPTLNDGRVGGTDTHRRSLRAVCSEYSSCVQTLNDGFGSYNSFVDTACCCATTPTMPVISNVMITLSVSTASAVRACCETVLDYLTGINDAVSPLISLLTGIVADMDAAYSSGAVPDAAMLQATIEDVKLQYPAFDTVGMHRDRLMHGREHLQQLVQISDLDADTSTRIMTAVKTIIDPLIARFPGFIVLRCAIVGAAAATRADRLAVHESLKQHKHLPSVPAVLAHLLSSDDPECKQREEAEGKEIDALRLQLASLRDGLLDERRLAELLAASAVARADGAVAAAVDVSGPGS